FFIQAEDGIRGRNVTGVQTCALPITLTHSYWPLAIVPIPAYAPSCNLSSRICSFTRPTQSLPTYRTKGGLSPSSTKTFLFKLDPTAITLWQHKYTALCIQPSSASDASVPISPASARVQPKWPKESPRKFTKQNLTTS